jgi:hypothetical protein
MYYGMNNYSQGMDSPLGGIFGNSCLGDMYATLGRIADRQTMYMMPPVYQRSILADMERYGLPVSGAMKYFHDLKERATDKVNNFRHKTDGLSERIKSAAKVITLESSKVMVLSSVRV